MMGWLYVDALIRRGNIITLIIGLSVLAAGCVHAQMEEPESESHSVSKCFSTEGLMFVTLFCGHHHIIHIKRAFHGAHPDPPEEHATGSDVVNSNSDCFMSEGDCVVDVMDTYDWSRCEDHYNCVQSLEETNLPDCGGHVYLQVDYTCVPGIEKPPTTTTIAPPSTTTVRPLVPPKRLHPQSHNGLLKPQHAYFPPQPLPQNPVTDAVVPEDDIHDICTNFTKQSSLIELRSPGYPDYYPPDMDCRCSISAANTGSEADEGKATNANNRGSSGESRVAMEFMDLVLGMMKGRCYDWLMWESPDTEGSRMVSCGDMNARRKLVQSHGSQLEVYFHTGKTAPIKKLRGFKVRLTGRPEAAIDIRCYRSTSPDHMKRIVGKPPKPHALPDKVSDEQDQVTDGSLMVNNDNRHQQQQQHHQNAAKTHRDDKPSSGADVTVASWSCTAVLVLCMLIFGTT